VTGLSEAYGAFESGREGIPSAAWRGLARGPAKAKYPSFAERLVPEEEGEGFARKFTRFGAELATDPLTWVGPGLVKGGAKLAVKGAKLAAGTKLAQGIARSGAAEDFARVIGLPLKSHVSFFGKDPAFAGRLEAMEARFEELAARSTDKLTKAAKGLTEAQRLKARGVLQQLEDLAETNPAEWARRYQTKTIWNGITSGDQKADAFAKFFYREGRALGKLARKMEDPYGMPFLTRVANPVKPSLKTLRRDFKILQQVPGKLTRQKAQDVLMQVGNVSRSTAHAITTGELRRFDILRHPTIMGAAGKRLPLPYIPQILKREFVEQMATPAGMQKVVSSTAKRFRISEEEAEAFLKQQAGFVRRAGSIEYARQMKLPPDMLEQDPLKILDVYSRRLLRRFASASEFGIENQKLEAAIQAAIKAGMNPDTGTLLRNAVQGVRDPRWIDKIAPSILGFQAITKMGPTSSIAQLFQNVNNIIAYRTGNFAKGLYRLSTDKKLGQRALLAANSHLQQQMAHLIGQASLWEKAGAAPKRWLTWVGFNWTDRGARTIGYASGVAAAENAAKAAGYRITPALKAMGLEARDMGFLARYGKLTPGAERRVGLKAAKITQFTTNYLDLPPLWQTAEMRIAMQFKNFVYQQTRFLTNQVVKPAAKYFETGGREGDVGPLMRALVAYPVAGQGVAAARDLFQEMMAEQTGVRRRKPRKFDYNHPVAQMVQDSLYVGAFGMAGDLVQQASRGRLLDWLAGPTVGDVTENLEFLGRHISKMEAPESEQILSRLIRHVPGRRAVPLDPQEIAEMLKRKF
jgi:hypothetical protein